MKTVALGINNRCNKSKKNQSSEMNEVSAATDVRKGDDIAEIVATGT